MPHTSHGSHAGHPGASSGDDLGSTDEVKVFKDEGDREDEKISSENLLEEKSSLIDLTESEEKSAKNSNRPDHSPVFGKDGPHAPPFNMGYLVSPYSYTNGAAAGFPVSMSEVVEAEGQPEVLEAEGQPEVAKAEGQTVVVQGEGQSEVVVTEGQPEVVKAEEQSIYLCFFRERILTQ
ncbi:hypothetical protein DMENIID0001_070570 [Sergentomyia squamirostris]